MTKRHTTKILFSAAAVATLLATALSSPASAQYLPQITGGTIQQQSSQTQSTNNTQPRTDSPQTGASSQSILNQKSSQSLQVKSDPYQNKADATIQPSSNLKAENTLNDQESSSTKIALALAGLLAFVLIFVGSWRYVSGQPEEILTSNDAYVGPSTAAKTTKPKRAKKKRKKPHQR